MGTLMNMVGALGALGGVLVGVPIAGETLTRALYNIDPIAYPKLPELILMRYRQELTQEQYTIGARLNGFNETWANKFYKSSEQLLGVNELISSWRRKIITEDILDKGLEQAGFNTDNITVLKKVTEFFPAPPDLVRFAVREVYTPTIRQKFGMDEDFPPEFLENAGKAGLPEQMAKDFWAAHWELPSPLQGNRMLHRGIIDESEHDLLLKSLDIMPFWRTRLKDLSFNPLTRVDVRRMYGLDVLDIAGVNKAYRDIGYNEDNAAAMTEFTIKFQNDENKGITRASVVSAFKKGAISEDDLITYLKALRYSDNVVNFWANFALHDKVTKEMDDLIDTEMQLYVEGISTLDQFQNILASWQVPDNYVKDLLKQAELKKRKRGKMPSKDDLGKWLAAETIDDIQYKNFMLDIGYQDSHIDLFIENILGEPALEV